jgi:hypothetical protein
MATQGIESLTEVVDAFVLADSATAFDSRYCALSCRFEGYRFTESSSNPAMATCTGTLRWLFAPWEFFASRSSEAVGAWNFGSDRENEVEVEVLAKDFIKA